MEFSAGSSCYRYVRADGSNPPKQWSCSSESKILIKADKQNLIAITEQNYSEFPILQLLAEWREKRKERKNNSHKWLGICTGNKEPKDFLSQDVQPQSSARESSWGTGLNSVPLTLIQPKLNLAKYGINLSLIQYG